MAMTQFPVEKCAENLNCSSGMCCVGCGGYCCSFNDWIKCGKINGVEKPSSSTKLAIILSSILGLMVLVLLMQSLLRRRMRRRAADTDVNFPPRISGFVNNELPEVTSPPHYDDIHLYKELGADNKQAIYYCVPGIKGYFGVVSDPPPPYKV
ncbi:uncharacterized protein LOC104266123 isoform X1 [Ciona intestinalis]